MHSVQSEFSPKERMFCEPRGQSPVVTNTTGSRLSGLSCSECLLQVHAFLSPPPGTSGARCLGTKKSTFIYCVEEECVTMLARRPCPALSSEAGGSRSPPFLVGTSVIVDTSHYISGPWVSFFSLKWREVRPLPQVLLISKTTQEAVVRGVVDNLTVKHVAAMPLPVRRALSVRIPRRTLEELPFYLSLGNEIVTYCCSSGSVFCLFKPY